MREAPGASPGPNPATNAGTGVRAAASGRGEVIRAYANSPLGRETLRRELVEGASVQAGQDALVLRDAQPADGMDEIVRVVVETLRELGVRVTVMAVDGIPVRAGATAGAWAHVEKHRAPAAVYEAIRAADVVLDYTAQSRGAQKYNQDFYTLAMYYAKRICAHRALEAGEVLGTDPSAPIAQPDALLMPSDLLRLIAEHVSAILIGAAKSRLELRLTNPWGTDLRFTMLPGDVVPSGGIRHYPERTMFAHAGDDNNRLYVTLAGCTVTQRCEGVWVAKHCSLLGGELREPIQVRFAGGFIVGADGGEEARRLMEALADEAIGIHAILTGLNPKAAPFRDGRYLLANNGAGAGVSHLGLGGPGLFYRAGEWGGIGNKHFQLGCIPKVSLWAGDRCVFQEGVLQALTEPAIREAARRFGDPDALLRQFEWPAEV